MTWLTLMSALYLQLVNDVKQNLPFKDDDNKENVGANPIGVVQMEESLDKQMEKTKFGPKAVMKKGTLGNYEPNYKIKSGPGMLVSMIESVHGENWLFLHMQNQTQISFAVTTKLISTFVFATQIVQSLCLLILKFQASRHLLCRDENLPLFRGFPLF